jgi:glycosyltransferase involved in cell wall biosynthesis
VKRILYIDLSPSPGGSIISLYHLASHLDRTRYQPLVVLSRVDAFDRFWEAGVPVARVSTPRWDRPSSGMVERVRAGRLGEEMRRRPNRARLWHWLGGLRRLQRDVLPVVPPLLRLIRDFRPHLIHLNDILPLNRHGALAGRLARVPVVGHCRSFATPTANDNRFLLPGMRGLIFISEAIARTHLAAMPRPPRYRVIPNAIDLADYAAQVDAGAVRADLGVPAGVPLVGMVGRVSPWKGQHVFVDALAQLSQVCPHVHGSVVGLAEEADGPGYADQVRKQAAALGLERRFHMAGYREDVPRVLGALDVVVHCSVKPEPFGRVIIEGMAAGKPVVASKAGGAAEIITDGVDGLLMPPGDAGALAAVLARLLADPDERARLGAAGRATAEKRYQVGAHVAAVQDFYDEILASEA